MKKPMDGVSSSVDVNKTELETLKDIRRKHQK